MKKLILFFAVFCCAKANAQVYQEMPQYGYRANRMSFDSTLQIPTVCGVPTLKSVQFITKKAAIAYDSCNAVFYTYSPKTQTWSAVSGGGGGATDTTNLSNRINLKLNIADTSSMLTKYLRKTDTVSLSNRINQRIDSIIRSTDSIFARKNGAFVFQYKDSVGGGGDTSKVVIAQVHNATATTLLRGEVVFLFGSNGNVASVKRANNKDNSTSAKTIGIVRSNISAGSNGFITTQGQVDKLNLGSYVEGDVLYLDSIDGQLTKIKPQAPYHSVFIGIVERANNGNGLAYIKVQNGVELNEIHDVQINNILNNQIIVYSDTQKVWKNRNVLSIIDTTTLFATKSNVALKLNITDTTALQRKSLSANTIMANNTASTANATAQAFKDTSGTYNGTITFTGTTAPSGATNHSFRLTQVGKCVTLHIALVFATNGAGLTTVQLTLPAGAPTPIQPAGLTAATTNMYPITANIVSSANQSILSAAVRGYLRNNTAANGFEIFINFSSAAPGQVGVTLQYWTN